MWNDCFCKVFRGLRFELTLVALLQAASMLAAWNSPVLDLETSALCFEQV